MIHLEEDDVRRALTWDALIESISEIFRDGCTVAPRVHHDVAVPGSQDGTLLLMPAWRAGTHVGVKIVTVFPENAEKGILAVAATYVMFDGRTGVPLACLAASTLTAKRTAAASALASRYLSRPDATRLLIVGTGRVARELAYAHSAVRPIRQVTVWGRNPAKSEQLAAQLRDAGIDAEPVVNLQAAVASADIVSCATLSQEPLIMSEWVRDGTHIDLVGAFKPTMAEADAALIGRGSLFVDTRLGAATEAGDIIKAIAAGSITLDRICADLSELVRDRHPGRTHPAEITIFKSVGTASEDLAAAALVIRKYEAEQASTTFR